MPPYNDEASLQGILAVLNRIELLLGNQQRTDQVAASEQEPVAMSEQEPVAMSQQEPVAMSEQEPVAMSEQEPVAMSEQEPVAMSEQELVATSEQEPSQPMHLTSDSREPDESNNAMDNTADDTIARVDLGEQESDEVQRALPDRPKFGVSDVPGYFDSIGEGYGIPPDGLFTLRFSKEHLQTLRLDDARKVAQELAEYSESFPEFIEFPKDDKGVRCKILDFDLNKLNSDDLYCKCLIEMPFCAC